MTDNWDERRARIEERTGKDTFTMKEYLIEINKDEEYEQEKNNKEKEAGN